MLPFSVERQARGTAVRLVLTGDLDLATAGEAEAAIVAAEEGSPPLLILDLSELAFMDSTGLRVIVSAATRARDEDRRLVLVKGPDVVQRVFEITRLAERLEIVDSVDGVF
ncbi:MAG TPA: STAS domain-containing protein [Solirubrobacteraceae bacterium]|nr:STAS domain-containing protein [Solirubrobacteraceae bacterium]